MKIAALISVWEDDELLPSAIYSVQHLDRIFVFDGPTTSSKNEVGRPFHHSYHGIQVIKYNGAWKSDADKRTEILKEAQAWDEDAWGLWLDGDEILLFGEYLKDHVTRAAHETGAGGFTIRIVEYDGSVALCYGKIIKLRNVRNYTMSSYEVELDSGLTIALPNVPICSSGGIPIGEISGREDEILSINRPPVIGEPHLLHRHGLRNPERSAPRLHDKEAEDFQLLLEEGR